MEQIYVIKVKEPIKDSGPLLVGKCLLDGKDLIRRSLFGFSIFQLIFALLCIVFSLLGSTTDWTYYVGVVAGLSHLLSAIVGLFTSERRKIRLSEAKSLVYLTIGFSIYSSIVATIFVILILIGNVCTTSRSMNLQACLITANFMQCIFALFTAFICTKIFYPTFGQPWIQSWPYQPKIRAKTIVKTSIYPHGLNEDQFSQTLGPNCIVSLVQPNNETVDSSRNDVDIGKQQQQDATIVVDEQNNIQQIDKKIKDVKEENENETMVNPKEEVKET